jgi:hypothetical protein
MASLVGKEEGRVWICMVGWYTPGLHCIEERSGLEGMTLYGLMHTSMVHILDYFQQGVWWCCIIWCTAS